MEKKLSRLFDFQKYENNPKLEKIISAVDSRYPEELQPLSEDFLGHLNAAGNIDVMALKQITQEKE